MQRLLERLRVGLPSFLAGPDDRRPAIQACRTDWLCTLPETIRLPVGIAKGLDALWEQSVQELREIGMPFVLAWRGGIRMGEWIRGDEPQLNVKEVLARRDVVGLFHTHEVGLEGVAFSAADLHVLLVSRWLFLGVRTGQQCFLAVRPNHLSWSPSETNVVRSYGESILFEEMGAMDQSGEPYQDAVVGMNCRLCSRYGLALYGNSSTGTDNRTLQRIHPQIWRARDAH